jgi:hypothetical protein
MQAAPSESFFFSVNAGVRTTQKSTERVTRSGIQQTAVGTQPAMLMLR